MKCLDDSGYDRAKCEDYFVNYRICRKFWVSEKQIKVKDKATNKEQNTYQALT